MMLAVILSGSMPGEKLEDCDEAALIWCSLTRLTINSNAIQIAKERVNLLRNQSL
jgi:hypothetical protein